MRYIRVDNLKDGMINYKTLFGKNNEILLSSGAVIKESYIPKLKDFGYYGIYIEDSLSEGIEASVLIEDKLRFECMNSIKDIYNNASRNKLIEIKVIDNLGKYIDEMIDSILANKELFINIIDLKGYDDYTFSHSVNVAVLSLAVGIMLNVSRNVLYKLGMSALLHDIGKIFVPKEILNKKSKLNEEEFAQIKLHPLKGYELLKNNNYVSPYSCIGILHHHEKFNGTGYPMELSGDNISLLGRIIMIADVYDALTSDRPYRKGLFPSEAIEYIMGGGGTLFDPDIVKSFIKIIAPYPVGTSIKLNNNKSGIVVRNYPDFCMRPVIKVLFHQDKLITPYLIDLKNDTNCRDVVITGMADF